MSTGNNVSIIIDALAPIGYIYNRKVLDEECDVPRKKQEPSRGPMIHIRLDETTHRNLKIHVAHDGTTIQHLVADLIRREIGESVSLKKTK